jgi:hypothetical protein
LMGAPWILWDILNMIKPSNFKGDDSAWRSMVFGSADYRHQVTQGEVGDFWGSESTSLNYPLGQVTTSITRKTRVCFTCFWIPPFFPWKHAQKKMKKPTAWANSVAWIGPPQHFAQFLRFGAEECVLSSLEIYGNMIFCRIIWITELDYDSTQECMYPYMYYICNPYI